MRNERMKEILNPEELALQKKLKESINPRKTDLWPSLRRTIAQENIGSDDRARRSTVFSKRAWVPAAVLVMALGLMGAGILKYWFVYNSDGQVTTLTESEGFISGEEYAVMKPSAKREANEELYNPYDWVDNREYIPGGLQIPGNTAEERNIPELREKMEQLPPAAYAEVCANGITYTAVQGSFTADYEVCKKSVSGNVLGVRLPDESLIPADYCEHLSFTTGYYLGEKDYAAREEVTEDKTEKFSIRSYRLPESVKQQVGSYALQWFKADKSPILCTAHLAPNDEWYIPTTDETDIVKPLVIDGFDKALYWEHDNKAYAAKEISVMLWQKVDPVMIMEVGYTTEPLEAERQYIVYILDAVGISEEDAVRIAKAW